MRVAAWIWIWFLVLFFKSHWRVLIPK
jgi:hypothetical protein